VSRISSSLSSRAGSSLDGWYRAVYSGATPVAVRFTFRVEKGKSALSALTASSPVQHPGEREGADGWSGGTKSRYRFLHQQARASEGLVMSVLTVRRNSR
jgi:hypothetical protein